MREAFRRPPSCRGGFALPAVLVIVAALVLLAVGLLTVVGLERTTARSYADSHRADLAARAAVEDVKGMFSTQAGTDSYVVLQRYREDPLDNRVARAPMLFLAQGKASGPAFAYQHTPLFSCGVTPPQSSLLKAPEIESLIADDENSFIDLTVNPWQERVRVAWVPIRDAEGRVVARYAYWVEDLQARIDPQHTGAAIAATSVKKDYPFPAPGLMPPDSTGKYQALDGLALYALDPESTITKPGPLAGTLVKNRALMLSPDSLAAAAGLQPPLTRDSVGRLVQPSARVIEESLTTGIQPYFEQPLIPFAFGIAPKEAGKPKLNLNALLAKGPTAVDEMAVFINRTLPAFVQRKGGFPDDYLKTLAANAIDYADTDAKSTLAAGSHRGVDAFPLLSELILQVQYLGKEVTGGRQILKWRFRLFAELWNPSNQQVSGNARLSYEVALPMEGIGAGTGGRRFDDPALLGDPTKSTHNLDKIDGRYWTKPKSMTLSGNEYRIEDLADVNYRIDIGPSSIVPAPKFSLVEQEGAAGATLKWNDQDVDRAHRIIRLKTGLEFSIGTPRTAGKATVLALSLGPYGSFVNTLGDPRMSYYFRQAAHGENAYPDNISPSRRNIRRATIYDADSSRKPKTYGRVLPSEWPDGGHDSAVGTWPNSQDDTILPTAAAYLWVQNPQADQAPQRISNLGRFYSATELGRVYDPIMWMPAYDKAADTASIQGGLMPANRFAWPDVNLSSPVSKDHGGGNSLRIGRAEHAAFDDPERRASRLLDIFHTGLSRSETATERRGPLVEIRGQVNLNTASRDALRAMASGILGQDPQLATVPSSLNHNGSPLMAPLATKIKLGAPSLSSKTEADRIADAIILCRPYATVSEVSHVRDQSGIPVFGNPDLYQNGGQITSGNRVQWSDSAAEEIFARLYEASTVRSRNFRVWVVGQALAPAPVGSKTAPKVLAESRRVFTLFADPGERRPDGSLDPLQVRPKVLHERAF